MAKRFGRNQRRHMREEIARQGRELQKAHSLAGDLFAAQHALESRITRWNRELERLLGKYSVFLERTNPKKLKDWEIASGRFRLSDPNSYTLNDIIRADKGRFIGHNATYSEADLIEMKILFFKAHRDDFNRQLRMEVRDDTRSVGYALSQDAIDQGLVDGDDAIGWIAKQIAHEMTHFYVKQEARY